MLKPNTHLAFHILVNVTCHINCPHRDICDTSDTISKQIMTPFHRSPAEICFYCPYFLNMSMLCILLHIKTVLSGLIVLFYRRGKLITDFSAQTFESHNVMLSCIWICPFLTVGQKKRLFFLFYYCGFFTLTTDCAEQPWLYWSFSFLLTLPLKKRPYSDFDILIHVHTHRPFLSSSLTSTH